MATSRITSPGEVLRFDLDALRCGLPLASVREVQRAVAITPLPGAPAVVDGVIDLRGDLVPVLDLRERLGLPRVPLRASESLIFVWTGERLVAVRADRVEWIETAADEDFASAETLTRGPLEVAGVARTASGLVLLHDAEALLRQAEVEALERALAANASAEGSAG